MYLVTSIEYKEEIFKLHKKADFYWSIFYQVIQFALPRHTQVQ
jgi:hypothetical protein